jgi:hypothetical protein
LAQAGNVGAALTEIERSIAVARDANIQYEVALSLESLARLTDVEARADAARQESQAIFERLGVVATPNVPVPQLATS